MAVGQEVVALVRDLLLVEVDAVAVHQGDRQVGEVGFA
jgi:hypothetical protein